MTTHSTAERAQGDEAETSYAWWRLAISTAISTIGGVGLWSVVVALPAVQTEFGVARADASLPYTATMLGFAVGGVLMGRLADRFGIMLPAACGALLLGVGYVLSGYAATLWQFARGAGAADRPRQLGDVRSAGRRRVALVHAAARHRGRDLRLRQLSRRRVLAADPAAFHRHRRLAADPYRHRPVLRRHHAAAGVDAAAARGRRMTTRQRTPPPRKRTPCSAYRPNTLLILLSLASVACCVAMSMPQVHIVAYCSDLGYGVARGAEMLSLMLGFGVVSRVASGFIADRVGGVATLLLGSVLQATALLLYMMFDGLTSLYLISILFGLVQGGIVPSYAIIVREYFSPQEAATRLGIVLMASLFGMAFGGWISGVIFDLTGSYRAAFANGLAWNLLNIAIALWLLARPGRRLAPA